MRALVTGATGRVGGALAAILPRHMQVRAACRDPSSRPEPGGGAVWQRFDFLDPATHGPALDGVDALFLMRPPSMTRPGDMIPVLDAARAAGVARVTLLSVRGADRIRVLPHHGIEREVRRRFPGSVILRPADFMQNLETVHRAEIAERGEVVAPTRGGRSAFVDAGDVAEAAAATLSDDAHAGGAFDLSGPEALSFADVAAILTRVLGRPVRHRSPNVARFAAARIRAGDPPMMALVMTALYSAQRFGAAGAVTGDLPRLIGRPPTPFLDHAMAVREVWTPPGAA